MGFPLPGFATSLSGGLLGHFLALTGPKYGAKRDPAWVRHRGLHPLLSWHLATALADVLPIRPQLPSMVTAAWKTIPDMNQPCLTELSVFSVVFLPCALRLFSVSLCDVHKPISSQLFAPRSLPLFSILCCSILGFSPSFLVGFSISSSTFCVFYCCSRGLIWNRKSCFTFVVNSSCVGLGYMSMLL